MQWRGFKPTTLAIGGIGACLIFCLLLLRKRSLVQGKPLFSFPCMYLFPATVNIQQCNLTFSNPVLPNDLQIQKKVPLEQKLCYLLIVIIQVQVRLFQACSFLQFFRPNCPPWTVPVSVASWDCSQDKDLYYTSSTLHGSRTLYITLYSYLEYPIQKI